MNAITGVVWWADGSGTSTVWNHPIKDTFSGFKYYEWTWRPLRIVMDNRGTVLVGRWDDEPELVINWPDADALVVEMLAVKFENRKRKESK